MAEGISLTRAIREIARNEVRRLSRDRRALFSAVLLPALIYPLFFHGQSWLKSFSTQSMAERTVRVALDLEHAPEEIRASIRAGLTETNIELLEVDEHEEMSSRLEELGALTVSLHEGQPDALERQQELVQRLLDFDFDVLVSSQPHAVLPARHVLHLYHDGSNETSNEALARVQLVIDSVQETVRTRRIEALLGPDDPARGLDLLAVDLASERDAGGAALGSLLPLLAMLVLISGGSFAALGAFAGEREAGTLETLLVQPIPAAAVSWGKFYAVLAVALAALACNVGSLLVSLSLGLGALPGLEPGQGEGVVLAAGGGRLLAAGLLFLPTAVTLSALLSLISARARTFREGQHLLLPLTLIASIPAGVAGWTETPLDGLTALAPLLGACLSLRDTMRGSLEVGPALIAAVAGLAWAALALRALAHALSNERILQGDVEREARQLRLQSRTALAYGAAAALGSYILGGWLQARFGLSGLLATLWIFLPLLSWMCVRRIAARAGETLGSAMWLRLPSAPHLAGTLLLAPGVALAVRWLVSAQSQIAPLPNRMLESADGLGFLGELGPLGLFFVLAVSPGVCEELFFRGAMLSGLRRDLSAGRTVLLQALVFGAAHASVHRFLPTALVGALLAALTLRTRSLIPAILLHIAYDGMQVLAAVVPWTDDPTLALLAIPGAYLILRPTADRPAPLVASAA